MPSIFTHAAVAAVSSMAVADKGRLRRVAALSLFCAVLPDADVIAFSYDIPYSHFFGHRGFFHSPFFALLLSLSVVLLFFRERKTFSRGWWCIWGYFFLVTASHGVLDAFTNGGLGIALLIPFDDSRFFFPLRPIRVSPLGVDSFFSSWGFKVMVSEIIHVWIPLVFLYLLSLVIRKKRGQCKDHRR
jgi:inner membrane protein